MDKANALYIVGAVLFFGVPAVLAAHRFSRGGFSDEGEAVFHFYEWIVGMVVMYCAVALMTYIFSATVEVLPSATGMSNTEKLAFGGLTSSTYPFRENPKDAGDSFSGFYGYTTGAAPHQTANTVFQVATPGQLTRDYSFQVDPSKVRIVPVTRNYRVVLKLRKDNTRNPVAFADGTAAIPHFPSGCKVVFQAIWPTCVHDVYTEKVINIPFDDLDLLSPLSKDLMSETFYVPASFARIYHPGQ